MKYFLFNKAMDFRKGCAENCVWQDGALCLKNPAHSQGGAFVSRLLDTGEAETVWDRLRADLSAQGDASVQIFLYTAESAQLLQLKNVPLSSYLLDARISADEKQRVLAPYLRKTLLAPKELPLYEVKGRYLWVVIRLFGQENSQPRLRFLQLCFPKESWTAHLPAIYRQGQKPDAFLDRYLFMFQTMYEALERDIRQADRLLDPALAKPEVLAFLAQWIGVEQVALWQGERLRCFLPEALALYAKRGTRAGLLRMAELYTGRRAFLLEYQQLTEALTEVWQRRVWERLYGTDKYTCFLLVEEEAVRAAGEKRALAALAEEFRPAHIRLQLVVLGARFLCGNHSYLGVNTRLARANAMQLDGASQLSLSYIAQSTEEEH